MNNEKTPGLGELLRAPGEVMGFADGKAHYWRLAVFLVLVTVVGCALFGFAVGSFVDLKVAALDAAKMVGIAVFSFVLCFRVEALGVAACRPRTRLHGDARESPRGAGADSVAFLRVDRKGRVHRCPVMLPCRAVACVRGVPDYGGGGEENRR